MTDRWTGMGWNEALYHQVNDEFRKMMEFLEDYRCKKCGRLVYHDRKEKMVCVYCGKDFELEDL